MQEVVEQEFGGIILCGGKSRRMGEPKLSLQFGHELLLQRVVRILEEVVAPIVVVAAPWQELPELPGHVRIARDEVEGLGPLGGLAPGLAAIKEDVSAAYVTAVDAPLLKQEFVRYMLNSLGEYDLAVPREGKFYHPLAGVYRVELEEAVRRLIASERLRPLFLIEESNSNIVSVEELRTVDPNLDSLRNTNTPEDYEAALQVAGLSDKH